MAAMEATNLPNFAKSSLVNGGNKEDEGGEEGAHQNNVDRLKASLEDLRIETHLPHHDDKDDPMEGLADLYCY